ncbi:MAG: ribosome biogenesis protein [Candidatus Aenigmarchaeota archaeon]|nr:ribosome biogenesis protein [Candidatus Aenigmarchaeota archaeon]
MMLKKCVKCGSYLLADGHCGEKTRTPHPPKFSSEDRFGKYRRMAKATYK